MFGEISRIFPIFVYASFDSKELSFRALDRVANRPTAGVSGAGGRGNHFALREPLCARPS